MHGHAAGHALIIVIVCIVLVAAIIEAERAVTKIHDDLREYRRAEHRRREAELEDVEDDEE